MALIRSPFAHVTIVWLAMLVLFQLKLSLFGAALFGDGYSVARHFTIAVVTTALVVPMILLARRHLDRRPISGLGLQPFPAAFKPLAVGLASWLVPFMIGVTVCLLAGWVRIVPLVPWLEILAFIPLLIVLVFLLEALPEELACRGYIYTNLAAVMSRWWAVVVQAVLFSLWGTILWTTMSGTVPVDRVSLFFFMGLVLGMLRVMSGSVWTAIGFHLAFQTVAQLLLNQSRGHFDIVGAEVLRVVVLGVVPFSLSVTLVGFVYTQPKGWLKTQPDSA